jgi:hypothetical protein
MAESVELSIVGERRKPAEPPPGDVLEEDALDGILGAELEDLLEGRLDRIAHGPNRVTG